MATTRTIRRVLLVFVLSFVAAFWARPLVAGENPINIRVGADEGALVRLVSGGPCGFGTQPHRLPIGAPAQVFHIPWQEAGWVRGKGFALWVISDHGVPKPRPEGAIPMTVMDHTLAIVYEADGKTPKLVAEMIPEAEGNWNVHEPGTPKFEFYMEQLRDGKLIPGKRGRIRPVEVGRVYGLGDHCCTNDANRLIGRVSGPGVTARGLNRLGIELERLGVTSAIRNTWQALGETSSFIRGAVARLTPSADGVVGMNLTRMWRVGNARIPYTPSIGGLMMGVTFAIHARKEGLIPATISAGAGIVIWEVGTRATIRAAGAVFGKLGAKIATRAIPIVGEVLLAADIALFLTNKIVGADATWGDVWDAYTGKLDKPTRLAGLPPPADQDAYYD